jgi:hypothetical protein
VGEVVNRGTTGVETDMGWLDGRKNLFLAGHRVVQLKFHVFSHVVVIKIILKPFHSAFNLCLNVRVFVKYYHLKQVVSARGRKRTGRKAGP